MSLVCGQSTGNAEASIDFDRKVRPILSDKCFPCHGPDSGQRQADLRLDRRDAIPSHVLAPAMGELVRRIRSDDPDERMPPPSSHLSLTDDQQQLLARWVAQGAEFTEHWSFKPLPRKVSVPEANDHRVRNEIDRFVLAPEARRARALAACRAAPIIAPAND